MLTKGVLLLVVGLFVGAADKDDPDKTAKALEGKWTVVAGEENPIGGFIAGGDKIVRVQAAQ